MDTAHDIPFTLLCAHMHDQKSITCSQENLINLLDSDIHINMVKNQPAQVRDYVIYHKCLKKVPVCTSKLICFWLFTTTVAVYFKTLGACVHIKR